MATPVLLDVRSPGEYQRAHIPGAVSFPLFSDDERHEVGICYKHQGRDAAVLLGLQFVGPKLAEFVQQAQALAPGREVEMYCWRGGMRSASMAWLLRTAGFKVVIREGGYKAWRNAGLERLLDPWHWWRLSGMTGSGKTQILKELHARGEQVIDLEALANHRGSAFGHEGAQPTTEHFENGIIQQLEGMDPHLPIWIEDESKAIGSVYLQHAFYERLQCAPKVVIHRSREERIDDLCQLYGQASAASLEASFERIRKRMGGQHVQRAIQHLRQGELREACSIALDYYDKTYAHHTPLEGGPTLLALDVSGSSPAEAADQLIQWKRQNLHNSATAQAAAVK